MKNVYMKAYERELEHKSKYLNQLKNEGFHQEAVLKNMEEDLVDVIVFCKMIIEKMRTSKDHLNEKPE